MEPCSINRWQAIKSSLKNLSFSEFKDSLAVNKNARLLDVRTLEEYQFFHLEKAIWLDYLSENLADQVEALNKNLHYFVYCRTSRRSIRVCQIMKNSGFENVYNLSEGLKDTLVFAELEKKAINESLISE
jgi:rhodanese-related sulfurtransferase